MDPLEILVLKDARAAQDSRESQALLVWYIASLLNHCPGCGISFQFEALFASFSQSIFNVNRSAEAKSFNFASLLERF